MDGVSVDMLMLLKTVQILLPVTFNAIAWRVSSRIINVTAPKY